MIAAKPWRCRVAGGSAARGGIESGEESRDHVVFLPQLGDDTCGVRVLRDDGGEQQRSPMDDLDMVTPCFGFRTTRVITSISYCSESQVIPTGGVHRLVR